jgi:hypothetical protein
MDYANHADLERDVGLLNPAIARPTSQPRADMSHDRGVREGRQKTKTPEAIFYHFFRWKSWRRALRGPALYSTLSV